MNARSKSKEKNGNETTVDNYNKAPAPQIRALMQNDGDGNCYGRKIKHDELAKKLSCLRQTVGDYVNGVQRPNLERLEIIADFFDVSCDFLLGRSTAKNIDNAGISAKTGLSDISNIILGQINAVANGSDHSLKERAILERRILNHIIENHYEISDAIISRINALEEARRSKAALLEDDNQMLLARGDVAQQIEIIENTKRLVTKKGENKEQIDFINFCMMEALRKIAYGISNNLFKEQVMREEKAKKLKEAKANKEKNQDGKQN